MFEDPFHTVSALFDAPRRSGQCDYGICQMGASRVFAYRRASDGSIGDRRGFCELHATSEAYAFARRGGEEER